MATQTLKEELNFYKGEVKIIFYPNSYSYKHPGERDNIHSASKIAGYKDKSEMLLIWKGKCTTNELVTKGTGIKFDLEKYEKGEIDIDLNRKLDLTVKDAIDSMNASDKEKDEACDIGGKVHEYAENYGKAIIKLEDMPGYDEMVQDEIKLGIQAFNKWVLNHNVEFLECEKRLYSKDWDVIGITDLIAIIDDKKMIIDYKTSKDIYDDNKIQGCIYRKAYMEEYGEDVGVGIVNFNKKTGEMKFYVLTDEEIELYTELAESHNKSLKTHKKIQKYYKLIEKKCE